MQTINFTVDSELLRELGERLVGRQYIALAELVKNSFDADATRVEIRIHDDSIEVSDNGHGMTENRLYKPLDACRLDSQGSGADFTGVEAKTDWLKRSRTLGRTVSGQRVRG